MSALGAALAVNSGLTFLWLEILNAFLNIHRFKIICLSLEGNQIVDVTMLGVALAVNTALEQLLFGLLCFLDKFLKDFFTGSRAIKLWTHLRWVLGWQKTQLYKN